MMSGRGRARESARAADYNSFMAVSEARRILLVLLCAWGAIVAPIRAAFAACPMHSGGAASARVAHSMRGRTAAQSVQLHHASTDRHERSPAHDHGSLCNCIGDCAGPTIAAPPPDATQEDFDWLIAPLLSQRDTSAPRSVRSAFLLPFPTAPPVTAVL